MTMHLLVPQPAGLSLLEIITSLGLTGNLKLCLDAGDGASLPAASASWLDRSGNGYDFFRGTTAGAESSDPTINGTANNRSSAEFLSFDGGDTLKYNTTPETWMNNLHKEGALFSYGIWINPGTVVPNLQYAMGSATGGNGSTPPGVAAQINQNGQVGFLCQRAPGAAAFLLDSNMYATAGKWQFLGGTINENGGAGASFLQLGDNTQFFNGSYSSPSASSTSSFSIGSGGGNVGTSNAPVVSGTKIAQVMFWEGVGLTQPQLDSVYQITRNRYSV